MCCVCLCKIICGYFGSLSMSKIVLLYLDQKIMMWASFEKVDLYSADQTAHHL